MQNTTSTVIALLISIILILIVPIMTLTERNDNVAQEKVKQIVDEFVLDIRNTAVITSAKCETFESKLSTTGNTYNIEYELQILDENPGKKANQANVVKIGENVYYTEYTSQVLEKLEKQDGKVDLKEGDYITVKVENQNTTAAQNYKRNFLLVLNTDQYAISATSSGMINANASTEDLATPNAYLIKYDANGGENAPLNQIKQQGENIPISTATPTRKGYKFIGWNTMFDGTGTNYTSGQLYSNNKTVTLYAMWEILDEFTIEYNANGATSGSVPATQTKNRDESIYIKSPYALKRNGFEFVGWNTSPDGNGIKYVSGQTYTENDSLKLYAMWSELFTVEYDANGADGDVPETHVKKRYAAVQISFPDNLEKSGYEFSEWNTQPDGKGTKYLPGEHYSKNESVILYAIWTEFAVPVWTIKEDLADPLNINGTTATVVVQGTDNNLRSYRLEENDINVYVNGVKVSDGIEIIVSNAKAIKNGVEYTITVKGYSKVAKQLKIEIAQGTLTDNNNNINENTSMIIYNQLITTKGEGISTSGFLENPNVQRENIENITFKSSISGKNNKAWDVSEQGDGSILAWYTKNANGKFNVYIGSESSIYANTNSQYMFSYIGSSQGCQAVEVITNIELLNTNNVTDMSYMFYHCGYNAMTSLKLGDNFNVKKVTDMSYMFAFCGQNSMTSLDLGDNFKTTNVTDMSSMFFYCGYETMKNLNLGYKFDTSKVTDMSGMFTRCGANAMDNLDLGSNFNTSKVYDMSNMFYGCQALEELILGDNFNTSQVKNMDDIFFYCTSLTKLDLGPKFKNIYVDGYSGIFENCGVYGKIKIYVHSDIYSDENNFAIDTDGDGISDSTLKFDRGTIIKKY